jgi:hypothetical protein
MSSGVFLKQADLAKSAPRLNGSMVFEVLTLRFLNGIFMIFGLFPVMVLA